MSLILENYGFSSSFLNGQFPDFWVGLDDGELFIEDTQCETISWDDGCIRSANIENSRGFGLRFVLEDKVAYLHGPHWDLECVQRTKDLISTLSAGSAGQKITLASAPAAPSRMPLYEAINPIWTLSFEEKILLLSKIDRYIRQKDSLVKQVSISIYSEYQSVGILRPDMPLMTDKRPLVRFSLSVVLQKGLRMESASLGEGGRYDPTGWMEDLFWVPLVDQLLVNARLKLESIPSPAGEFPVVLGPGWPGVLLHEAVGHGLEGDYNRKATSAFSHLIGKRVASSGVTVVDDGTLMNRRGSLSIDDEGTETQCNVLIEDGILKGYLFDRLNARLMGTCSTGNGRRENYASQPLPRMTNTYMLAGNVCPSDIISSVSYGIYATYFSGGQVDTTSGKFVFSASDAFLIENGKITAPLKGATLIGSGTEVLMRIKAIGSDLQLDKGIGTCGKAGQSVPVGVGQPTLLIESMTVGGTGK